MDGYHLYRKDLDSEGIRRRGAPFTFDLAKFKKDISALKQNKEGKFPSFDHSLKDPIEDDIVITKNDKVIIMEGLYLFLKEMDIDELLDYKIFL